MSLKKRLSEVRKGDCVEPGCGKRGVCLQGRGLCCTCHRNPEIRARHTAPFGKGRAQLNSPRCDPEEAELNALIAEQMACLPDWWHDAYPGPNDDPVKRPKKARGAYRQGGKKKS